MYSVIVVRYIIILVDDLPVCKTTKQLLSSVSCPESLANSFIELFASKVHNIRVSLDNVEVTSMPPYPDLRSRRPPKFSNFSETTKSVYILSLETTPEVATRIIMQNPTKSCDLDPMSQF